MKKKLIIITVSAVLLLLLTGCDNEPETLRVLVDLEYTIYSNSFPYDASINVDNILFDFGYSLKESGGLTDVEFECLPPSGSERDTAMKRIRAEIMAGEGPDVFIMKCTDDIDIVGSGAPLFSFPEKAMESGVFLPLDEYMENNTRFAEWDKMTQPVLDAGRNYEGQQIIPLTYTLPVLCYRQYDETNTLSKDMTWEEMLDDPQLSDEARYLGNCYSYTVFTSGEIHGSQINYFEYMFGNLADYEKEELLFTEKELLQRIEEVYALREEVNVKEKDTVGYQYETYLGNNFTQYLGDLDNFKNDDPLTMVPLYSDDGGCSAKILSFAAVNRNTKHPEDAYTVIDLLLRTHTMQSGQIYTHLIYNDYPYAVPLHEELMQKNFSIGGGNGYYMYDETFAEFCEVREQIT